jgi:uncharacterized protein
MDLTLHKPGDHHFIRSVGPEGITVTDTLYTSSLVLSADELLPDWPVRSVAELTEAHLEAALEMGPEIVILGTGRKQAFPPPKVMLMFYEKGIGFEAMTTEAACRTFNVLLSENRKAVAALIVSD